MVLCVLPHPGVAVVHVDSCYILIGKAGKDHEPLGQEVGLETIAGSYMGQIYYYLVGFSIVGFESEEDMVDEQVPIDLACFEPKERRIKKTQSKQFKVRHFVVNYAFFWGEWLWTQKLA